MLTSDAPLVLGILLGAIALFILGISFYFWKKVKEEKSHQDMIPSATAKPVKKVKLKVSDKEEVIKSESESEQTPETQFLFANEDSEIIPQGVRQGTTAAAPYDFSKDDKGRFDPITEEPEIVQSFDTNISEPVDPSRMPATRRELRNISWEQ